MDFESTQAEIVNNPESFATRHNLNRVTTVSKYLALALFVALPFLGAYVGYVYAPEKVVEVEKIVEVGKDMIKTNEQNLNWYERTDAAIMTGLFREEHIALNIEPLSEKLLSFVVHSQVKVGDSDLYFDNISFDPETSVVVLNENFNKPLLKVYPMTESFEFETFLWSEKMKNDMLNKDLSSEEAEESNNRFVRETLLNEFPNKNFSNLNWRDVCRITSWDYEGRTYYRLSYDEDEYGQFAFGFFCGTGTYETVDDLLIYNPGMPFDATEPKVSKTNPIKLVPVSSYNYMFRD